MAETESVLALRDITVCFGSETVYRDLSFSVRAGELLCILGPSGCGKSTSLRLMGDLLPVDSGVVSIERLPPSEGWNKLAYVFQQPRLAAWRTALTNVTLGMEMRFDGMPRSDMRARAADFLKLVGLERGMDKYPGMLSGGERQRVSIARALSVDPDIILMDEPFSALDLNTRQRLRSEIIRIWQQTGKTVVFVTHDIEEALVLADRILLMSNKPTRVLETLTIDEPRPRDVMATASLQARRDHLYQLFRQLEAGHPDEEHHA